MATDPKKEHTFVLDSFAEFEALARRALHEGKTGRVINDPFGQFPIANIIFTSA